MVEADVRCVAIVIPMLNEERHLERVVQSLAGQATGHVTEILIVDGGSTDSSLVIAHRLRKSDHRIRVLQNPKQLQSAAVNLAARCARPEVTTFVRADAHAEYPPNFIAALLDAQRQSGADSVVNRLDSRGTGCFQRAVAAVSNSKFGTGGAVHRSGGSSTFVDHGHHALFDRRKFESLGGYNESFIANEDAEFDTRLRAAGGKIWFTSSADVIYFPRDTLRGLAKQYYRYGVGRAGTRAKHGEQLRFRQMVPPILVLTLIASLLLGFWTPWALGIWGIYLAGVLAACVLLLLRTGDPCVAGAITALPAMHISWGLGFLAGTLANGKVSRST